MFTGLVQSVGTVVSLRERGDVRELVIEAGDLSAELTLGASVAVAGVCLTATSIDGPRFQVDVAQETLGRTRLGALGEGGRVNLELPLRASDRLGGHFVQGHVDGLGTVRRAGPTHGDYVLRIEHDPAHAHLVVEKGSIAIDGVSLTVTAAEDDAFEIMLIPHTLSATTLGALGPGDFVHLEYDILAKYVHRLIARKSDIDETG